MDFPTEFVSGMAPRDKIVTAAEAVALIRDGDTVVVEGFAGPVFRRGAHPGAGGAIPADRHPAGSDAGVHRGTGKPGGAGLGPVVLRGVAQAGYRRPLGDVGRARQDGRGEQDRRLQPAAGCHRAAVSRYRRGKAGAADPGWPGHVRRPAQRRREDQRTHHRRPGRVDDGRRSGVPVLQGIRAARRRVPSGHHRRPERQHHHGARGALSGVAGRRHRGAQRRRAW